MFQIEDDMTIHITRGDVGYFSVSADNNGRPYTFKKGDVVRFKVFKKKDCNDVAFQKDFAVMEDTEKVSILLEEEDTKIGEVISKPVDYWYEVELNPFTNPQTIIGYDDDGAKIFKLYPEGRDLVATDPEDLPSVDSELSLISEKPVQNRIVTKALVGLEERVAEAKVDANKIYEEMKFTNIRLENLFSSEGGNTDFEREVADIRVGVYGTVYPCAGDAIREQVRFVVETAESIRHDVLKVDTSSTTVPSNAFVDIQILEIGARITRDDIYYTGGVNEYADIKAVAKGSIINLRNNTSKNWFENGRHGAIMTDASFCITEFVHVSELEENNYEYEVKEDGYLYMFFPADDLAYEVILKKNFVQEFDSRLSSVETKTKEIDALKKKVSASEASILEIKEDKNIFLIDADKNNANVSEFGDKICEAFCSGKKLIVKDSSFSYGRDLVSYFPVFAVGLPEYNTNLSVSIWYFCGMEMKGIMIKTSKPFSLVV